MMFSLAVHDSEPVPVAVEREPEVRPVLAHRRDEIAHVLGLARVRMVVGEVAVDLAVQLHHVVPERPEQPRRDVSGHAVAAVDDDLPGLVTGHGRDLRADAPDVVPDDLRAAQGAGPANVPPGIEVVLLDPAPQILDGVTVQRVARQHDLQAVVVGRVVAAGDHDAAAGLQVLRREIEDGARYPSDVDDVAAALAQPLDERRAQLRTGVPPVAAHDKRPRAPAVCLGADRAADPPDDVRGQGIADDAPDVVGAKDMRGKWVAHAGPARFRPGPSGRIRPRPVRSRRRRPRPRTGRGRRTGRRAGRCGRPARP